MNQAPTVDILQLLQSGTIEVEGFLPWSSNYTFLVRIHGGPTELFAVYKPRQGERPLWDFAQGTLCQREQAAYVISHALGWRLVPPTVIRDGPHGQGSFQLFIEHDPECHYFTVEGKAAYRRPLQQIALLDIVINNADRKGGHVLMEQTTNPKSLDRLWAIDHGICFHTQYKLRTVIWEFASTQIPADLLSDLINLREQLHLDTNSLPSQLSALLAEDEIVALQSRLARLIKERIFWEPGPGRHYPWPPV